MKSEDLNQEELDAILDSVGDPSEEDIAAMIAELNGSAQKGESMFAALLQSKPESVLKTDPMGTIKKAEKEVAPLNLGIFGVRKGAPMGNQNAAGPHNMSGGKLVGESFATDKWKKQVEDAGPHNMSGGGGGGSGVSFSNDAKTKDLGQPRAYLEASHKSTVDDYAKWGVDSESVPKYKELAKEVTDPRQNSNMPKDLVDVAKEFLDYDITPDSLEGGPDGDDYDNDHRQITMAFLESAQEYLSRDKNPSVT